MNDQHLIGVIEGFYGQPWSINQRKELFKRMKNLNMNTYLYAPKDDLKHRADWRLEYTPTECSILKELIQSSIENKIEFVYAISPGLDICYSDENDQKILKQKFSQIISLGCKSFAILFDDIDTKLNAIDELLFDSSAKAQCYISNILYETLKPSIELFLFCPTEYCSNFSKRALKLKIPEQEFKLEFSEYLSTIGDHLHENIDILWTGPDVISKEITLEHINELINVIKRKPVIWENYHANDYDRTRVFLGPLKSRSNEIKNSIRGILTNPNCEFECNFNAFFSLAKWFESDEYNLIEIENDEIIELLSDRSESQQLESIKKWLPLFYTPTQLNCCNRPASANESDFINEIDLNNLSLRLIREAKSHAINSFESDESPPNTETEKPEDVESKLEPNELKLLCDFFYLPFDYGPYALFMLNSLKKVIHRLKNLNEYDQSDMRKYFNTIENSILPKFDRLCSKLDKIPNKQLKSDLLNNRLLGELKQTLLTVYNLIKLVLYSDISKYSSRSLGQEDNYEFRMRGGFQNDLKRLLEIENINFTNLSAFEFTQNTFKIELIKNTEVKQSLIKMFNAIEGDFCFAIKTCNDNPCCILTSDLSEGEDKIVNFSLIQNFSDFQTFSSEEFVLSIRIVLVTFIAYFKLLGLKGIILSLDREESLEFFENFKFLDEVDDENLKFRYEFF